MSDPRWYATPNGPVYRGDAPGVDPSSALFRPVVVIDPEDESATDRLGDILELHNWQPVERAGVFDSGADLANALREFANPKPKPEEPTGLGAVVEDADGERWVGLGDRYAYGDRRWKGGRRMTFTSYARIDAVRVLSEGVPES